MGLYRRGSSPPSPLLLIPPTRFIPSAMTSCASLDRAPRDMPPVTKRLQMDTASSTSESGTGCRSEEKSKRSRMAVTGRPSIIWRLYSLRGSRLYTLTQVLVLQGLFVSHSLVQRAGHVRVVHVKLALSLDVPVPHQLYISHKCHKC